MAQWKHRKPEPSTVRGFCVVCNKNLQKSRGSNKYRALCSPCDKKIFSDNSRRKGNVKSANERNRPYRKHVQDVCGKCGFKPEHVCQLDVDHIDGNHKNNALENLQTLCANCHRLKTFKERQTKGS